jgi:hypothetical protein
VVSSLKTIAERISLLQKAIVGQLFQAARTFSGQYLQTSIAGIAHCALTKRFAVLIVWKI